MKKEICLVGNITCLPKACEQLVIDDRVDVLVSTTSSIDSCFHINYERFVNGTYKKCVAVYDRKFGRYLDPDFGEAHAITEDSEFARVCFVDPRSEKGTGLENECYMFRLFLPLYFTCCAKGIELEVHDGNQVYTGDEFVQKQVELLGPPQHIDQRMQFNLYGFHNHNEYITDVTGKDNLIIFIGDSWVVGDNKDTRAKREPWHIGQLSKSFTHLVAEHIGADLVVCGSPGASNMCFTLNFFIWVLHNPDFLEQYQDVKIVFSSTAYDRDFSVQHNIGNWHWLKDYIFLQRTDKLKRDSRIAVEVFDMFCKQHSIERYYMLNHASSFHSDVIPDILDGNNEKLIAPNDGEHYNYNHLFKGTEYISSCQHPSDKGNEYLVQEVIKVIG